MSETKENLDTLLIRNDLFYQVPRDSSLVAERTFKEYPFDNTAYVGGGRPIIKLNSSADYIYGPTSYLAFDLSISGGADNTTADFGSANASQLFTEVVQESSSGQGIEHVKSADVVNYVRHKYQSDASFDDTWGGVTGAGRSDFLEGLAAGAEGPSVPMIVPMSMISKLWSQTEPLPSHLCAGMTIRLVLNSTVTGLVKTAGTVFTTYHVRNLRLVCDSVRLKDSAVKELRMQSGNDPDGGLKYTFSTFFSTSTTTANASVNIDVQRSAAVPVRIFAIPRLTATTVNPIVDSYASYNESADDIASWQLRSGSVFLPQQPISDSARSYVYTTLAFGKTEVDDVSMRKPLSTQVSYVNDYITNGGWVLAMPLYKSPTLSMSSDPTNNSRLINFQATVKTPAGITWDVILEYVSVANIMLENVVVDY